MLVFFPDKEAGCGTWSTGCPSFGVEACDGKVCDVGHPFVETGVCGTEVELGTEVEVCDADTTEGEGCSEGAAPHPSLPSLLV